MTFLEKLIYRFEKQAEFARDYSPLYACLFSTVAAWLKAGDDEVFINWLLAASNGRKAFDATLLLMAALHREVLLGKTAVVDLAAYYPTAGGTQDCHDGAFAKALRQAIMESRTQLEPFIQTATVQTNETGRGLAWLLPAHYLPWSTFTLVDLGASAGLNLVAEQRNYQLQQAGEVWLSVGDAATPQFRVEMRGAPPPRPTGALPHIGRRVGCDVAPFLLRSERDAQTLASFVWGDQVVRWLRLQEGLVALQQVNEGETAVTLHQTRLPDELPRFLAELEKGEMGEKRPYLLYNTYMTAYLPEKGRGLRQYIAAWAARQSVPVVWLQWEPAWDAEDEAPEFGWCAWQVDCWHRGEHRRGRLGWVQPHGTDIVWEAEAAAWVSYFAQLS